MRPAVSTQHHPKMTPYNLRTCKGTYNSGCLRAIQVRGGQELWVYERLPVLTFLLNASTSCFLSWLQPPISVLIFSNENVRAGVTGLGLYPVVATDSPWLVGTMGQASAFPQSCSPSLDVDICIASSGTCWHSPVVWCVTPCRLAVCSWAV